MTLDEALRFLAAQQVPPHLYTVGGLGVGECDGIALADGVWTVYFSERGARRNGKEFASEADAVAYFLRQVSQGLEEYEGRRLPGFPP